jgi:hypothetical protein
VGHGFQDVSPVLGARERRRCRHDRRQSRQRPRPHHAHPFKVAERLQRADGTFAAPKTILTVQHGASLAAGDVNADHNPDIYVVCGKAGTTNAPDYLLLGDASGGFTTQPIPEATAGVGDRAYALDYNGDGLTDFLVLNGQVPASGPIQLLTPHS